jgi:hypothetical protein
VDPRLHSEAELPGSDIWRNRTLPHGASRLYRAYPAFGTFAPVRKCVRRPAGVIQTLAAYRDDKANPEYYARRTVTRAYVKVALSEGADPEDVVRTISLHPPRVGVNGEQYARATVEEFQAKLGRGNQQARAGLAQTSESHQYGHQLGLGVMPS